ncbi:MAG: hypothetical protein AAFN41_03395 [Planctomycetota bacterium]
MRPRTVGILAIIFGTLLVTAFVTRSPVASSADPTFAIVNARPSEITEIRLWTADNSIAVERRPGGWVLVDEDAVWPADERRVSAGLRVLTSAVARSSNSAPDAAELSVAVVTDAGETSIDIAGQDLAGSRSASIDGRFARIDASLAGLLEPQAVRSWADTRVLPGLDPSVTQLLVQRWDGADFELARVGQRWGVRNPIVTPADAERVNAFIGRLSTARARIGPTDLIAPVFTVTASKGESSWILMVDPKGRGSSSVETLNETLTTYLVLDDEAAQTMSTELTDLLSARSIDLPSSDISKLAFVSPEGEMAFERLGRGWSDEADLVEALLQLLTIDDADEVLLQSAVDRADTILARVERFGNLPVGTFSLWTTSDHVLVNDGGVTRSYPRSAPAAARVGMWLSDGGR